MRSGFADRRLPALAAACLAIAGVACSATSPPPLPPRRVDFPQPASSAEADADPETVVRPVNLPAAAEAPSRDERYFGYTLVADAVSLVALARWTEYQNDFYWMAPWLLLNPAIHAGHGELRSAGISLVMRGAALGLLFAGGRVVDAECGSDNFICVPIGAFILLEAALVAPITIDAFVLARTRRPAPEWYGLPVLSAAVAPDGRRLLTLTGRF